MKWQAIIHGMIKRIPLISRKSMKSYFDSIDSKLVHYEHLKNAFMLLELAIWKSKISERFGQNVDSLTIEMKLQCRTDSLSMVNKIVPFVLPFLTDDDGGSNVVNSDDDDDNSDSDDEDEDEEEDGIFDDNGDEEAENNDGDGDDDHEDNIGFEDDMDDEDEDDEDDEGDTEGENIHRRRRQLR
jgi:cobalamin biosynthesis protein CobT